MDKVMENLYIGDNTDAHQDSKVDRVVNVSTRLVNTPKAVNIPMHDTDISERQYRFAVETVLNLLDEGHSVLVCCKVGCNRSAAVTLGVLVERTEMSFDTAYEHLQSKRSVIEPMPQYQELARDMPELTVEDTEKQGIKRTIHELEIALRRFVWKRLHRYAAPRGKI